ncbi:MAG: twin transmembrane helix small protein [Candidatus Portiera sp.]|nr:twin transmembrane helix small protein [Portiera sp.]
MYKVLLVLVFLAVMVSLWSSFFFMMKDRGSKNRMVNSLFVRVGLSVLLIVLIVYGYYSGQLSIAPSL